MQQPILSRAVTHFPVETSMWGCARGAGLEGLLGPRVKLDLSAIGGWLSEGWRSAHSPTCVSSV